MAEVKLIGLSKRFDRGGFALEPLDLTIADGEFLCLVGPSGCGKSTTLNLIAGLDEPSAGTVQIAGRDVTRVDPRARDVAMVFQSYALYPHLDVRGNLAFSLEVAGVPAAERKRRVEETAALLGIEGLLSRRPRELSGGQRQRVALGRALVRRPSVYLFDEPLSNLDAALRGQMRAELKKLHAGVKGTFVYVTHDQAEAMTLSDRVVLMREGRVEQVGPPRALYERPATLFAARFFGSPPINLCAPEVLGFPAASGQVVGVRPEHVRLMAEGTVRGEVELVEPMGADDWVTVAVGPARLVARCPGGTAPRAGEAVTLGYDAERVLRFDEASGRAREG